MNIKKILNIVFWVVIIIGFAFAGFTYYSRTQEQVTLEQIEQKIIAPDFELKTLEGETVKLSDYRGKVIFLNFWASWCPPCVQEMPDFNSANQKLLEEGNAVILAVNVQEEPQIVREFVKDNDLTLPVLLDEEGKVSYIYNVRSIPTTYIVNPDGTIYNVILGKTNEKTILTLGRKIVK